MLNKSHSEYHSSFMTFTNLQTESLCIAWCIDV